MGKNILIVGATSGIGRRLAELYAEEGWVVGIMGRREELLHEMYQLYPSNIHYRKADVAKENIISLMQELILEMNGVNVIVISSGIAEFNKDLLLEPELQIIDTNVKGFIQTMNTAWHYFKNKGGGQIVAITSVAAARNTKTVPAYNASKVFQSFYLEGIRLRAKYKKLNITITELIPGYVKTDMGKGDRMFWVTSVDKVARLSKKAIDKKKRRAFITKRWWWVYQVLKFLPAFIYEPMVNSRWKTKQKN